MLARVDTRPRRRNSHRADEIKRCEPFLRWLRGRQCHLYGKWHHECRGKVRACHVDYAGDKGMGTKVSDRHALPMCDGAHEEQHNIGWPPFEALHRFNALQVSAELYQHWLTRTEMGRIWAKRQAGEE